MEKHATATMIPAWNEGAQCGLAEEPWLRFLHDLTFGAQNECEAEFNGMGSAEKPYPFRIDTSRPAMPCIQTLKVEPGRRQYFEFVGRNHSGPAVGITNVRLFCPDQPEISTDDFVNVCLEVGGLSFDKAYANGMGAFTKVSHGVSYHNILSPNMWSFQEGRVIPLLEAYYTRICFETSHSFKGGDIVLLYDIVGIAGMTVDDLEKGVSYPHFQWQFSGIEKLYVANDKYSIRCQFNHPMVDIHLRTQNPIAAARLVLNNQYEIPFAYDVERGVWSIVFTPFGEGGAIGDLGTSLNASRVDMLTVELQPTTGEYGVVPPGNVVHWARNFHPARALRGLAGLRFSK